MQLPSFEFPVCSMWALAVAFVAAVAAMSLLIAKLRAVVKRSRSDAAAAMPDDASFPPVSVIVYDFSNASSLCEVLPRMLEQDYPAPVEVIVVNDAGRDATEEVIARLERTYSNLYMTSVPEESRHLSRRKLAITLGIKAARYEAVLLTGGNCLVESPMWLRSMMRHVAYGKSLVIGWAYPERPLKDDDGGKGSVRLRSFDVVRTAVEYLAWAIKGHPWRGTGYNMAMRSELFFRNKGFSRTLNLHRGDDDIWVREVATPQNCDVELSPDSMIGVMEADQVSAHMAEKVSREFTSAKAGRGARLTFSFVSWCCWLWLAGSVIAVVTGLPYIVPLTATGLLAVAFWLPVMFMWRSASVTLKCRRLFFTVPVFMLWHPFYTLLYKIRSRRSRRSNYTTVI